MMEKEKRVSFRIQEVLFQVIKKEARAHHMTASQFMRMAIFKYIDGYTTIEKAVNKASIESVAIGREILKRIDPKVAEQVKQIANSFYHHYAEENKTNSLLSKKGKLNE
jgi:hypothetical protein